MQPDEPNQEEAQEQLPQDGATPFQPAAPTQSDTANAGDPLAVPDALPVDHPATDSAMDTHEQYDEGVAGAAEVSDDSAASDVASFTPPPVTGEPEEVVKDDETV